MSDPAAARAGGAGLSLATYFSLAARNLRRNSRRTLLTLVSVIVAMGALTYLIGFVNAYMNSMQDNFVLVMNGHIQVYGPDFRQSNLIDDYMPDVAPVAALLDADPRVLAWTARVQASGLASVARATTAVAIVGVDPVREAGVSRLAGLVTEGAWLEPGDGGGVLLGDEVAENLEVGLGGKIVVMTQAPGGDIVSEAFRVRGILNSGVPEIDRALAIVTLATAQEWLGLGAGATEVVVRTFTYEDVDPAADALDAALGGRFDVERWYSIDPLIEQIIALQDVSTFILIGVVVAVVLGQLVNTMFMSLYDRVREFGLMEALGSRRRNLFAMLIAESLILVVAGGTIGYLLALLAVLWTGAVGIDLAAFGDTLGSLYIDSVIRPSLDGRSTAYVFGTIAATALLAGVLPAWRATRLDPAQAMRRI